MIDISRSLQAVHLTSGLFFFGTEKRNARNVIKLKWSRDHVLTWGYKRNLMLNLDRLKS
jgi:hypothetical protein